MLRQQSDGDDRTRVSTDEIANPAAVVISARLLMRLELRI